MPRWPCRMAPGGTWWPTRPSEARAQAGKVQGRRTTIAVCPSGRGARRASGRSPCGPPGWSRPTWSPTPRGASPAANRPRRAPTAGLSAANGTRPCPRWPAAWPTSTGGRSASCGPARTWSGSGPSDPRSAPAWPPTARASCGSGSPRPMGLTTAWGDLVRIVAAVAPGLLARARRRGRAPGLGRSAGGGMGRGRGAGRLFGPAPGSRGPVPAATCPSRWSPPTAAGPWSRYGSDETVDRRRWLPARCSTRSRSAPMCIGAVHQALGWVAQRGHRCGRRRDRSTT